MIPENYIKMNLKSPIIFKDKYLGKSALIIGTGLSTKKLIKYKDKINSKFDAVIGLNLSTINFEENLTHHLVIEKNPAAIYKDMTAKPQNYRKELPRILNFKGIHRFPKYLNIIKATRSAFDGKPKIREYNNNGCEGFLSGPISAEGFSVGSGALYGLHFACIMGCSSVYMVGVDLFFGKDFDHYYGDRFYRDNRNEVHKSKIITIEKNGEKYETTDYFFNSAKYIDEVVSTMCNKENISVYDFSSGLLSAPTKLSIDDFFKDQL